MSVVDFESGGTGATVPPVRWRRPETLLGTSTLIADGVVAMAGFAVAAIRHSPRPRARPGHRHPACPRKICPSIRGQLMLAQLALAEDWGLLELVPHGGATAPPGAGSPRAAPSPPTTPAPGTPPTAPSLRCTTPTGYSVSPWRSTSPSTAVCPTSSAAGSSRSSPSWPPEPCSPPSSASPLPRSRRLMAEDGQGHRPYAECPAQPQRAARGQRAAPPRRASRRSALDQDRRRRRPSPPPSSSGRPLPRPTARRGAVRGGSAGYCRRHQLADGDGTQYPSAQDGCAPLRADRGAAAEHLDVVPGLRLSAPAPKCMGSLVLMRADPGREWTDVE